MFMNDNPLSANTVAEVCVSQLGKYLLSKRAYSLLNQSTNEFHMDIF